MPEMRNGSREWTAGYGVMALTLVACGGGATEPGPPSHPELAAQPEPARVEAPGSEASPAEPSAQAAVTPPLPPLLELSPLVAGPDDVFIVDRFDGRSFVVLGLFDEVEREHRGERDWNWDERLVEPSVRVVPGAFRLAGPDGSCDATNGRAVVITTHSVPYDSSDAQPAATYRFSAVEVDATCVGLFAVISEHEGRFEWREPEIDAEFQAGRLGDDGQVSRHPVGVRGRFPGGFRFVDHPTCEGRASMEILHRGRRTRFDWSSRYAQRFGLLRVGRRDFFADLGMMQWDLEPLPASAPSAPRLPPLPSLTSLDTEHIEMEIWVCLPPSMVWPAED